MKGYNGAPDIYNSVVNFLEREINSITDASTEIIVCPFQESILETWTAMASEPGKKGIIQKIKSYTNDKVTNTNIAGPIEEVKAKNISDDKQNLLVILTDGKQSDNFGGNPKLLEVIKGWQIYSKIHDAYALYVMLTKESINPPVIDAIEKTDNIDVVTEPGQKEYINLRPQELITANIKDNTATIPLIYNSSTPLPNNIKVRVSSNDSVLNINQEVIIQNKQIVFDLKYAQPYEALKTVLAAKTLIPLKIELTNKNELQAIVQLTPEKIDLELVNKPEKILKIKIKNENK
jgi:hypothetical protein